jgi:hypothetical protein
MFADGGPSFRRSFRDASDFLDGCLCTLSSVSVSATPLPVTAMSEALPGCSSADSTCVIVGAHCNVPVRRSVVCEMGIGTGEDSGPHEVCRQQSPWLRSFPSRVPGDDPIRQIEIVGDGSIVCSRSSRGDMTLWAFIDSGDDCSADAAEGPHRTAEAKSLVPLCAGPADYVCTWESPASYPGRGLLRCRYDKRRASGTAEFLSSADFATLSDIAAVSVRGDHTVQVHTGQVVAGQASGVLAALVERSGSVAVVDLRCSSTIPEQRFYLGASDVHGGSLIGSGLVSLSASSCASMIVYALMTDGSLLALDTRWAHARQLCTLPLEATLACMSVTGRPVVLAGEQVAVLSADTGHVDFVFGGHMSQVLACCPIGSGAEDTLLSSAADGTVARWTLRR